LITIEVEPGAEPKQQPKAADQLSPGIDSVAMLAKKQSLITPSHVRDVEGDAPANPVATAASHAE